MRKFHNDKKVQNIRRTRENNKFNLLNKFLFPQGIPNIAGGSLLAVNHEGITFLRRDSHETFLQHPFSEILSTRRYRDDNNANFLDMKVGNLMVQQILRIETDQVSYCP